MDERKKKHVRFEINRSLVFSQPAFPERSRGLTAFVAVATSRYDREEARTNRRRRALWGAVAVLLVGYIFVNPVATGWLELATRLALPVAGLLVILLLAPGIHIFSSPRAARRVATIRRMNRARHTVGLESELDPGLIARFEPIAREWERIENALQSSAWEADEPMRDRVDLVAIDALADLLALNMDGHPVDAGSVMHLRFAELALAVEVVTNELDRGAASMDAMLRLNSRLISLSQPTGEDRTLA